MSIKLSTIVSQLRHYVAKVSRFRIVVFCVFVALVYALTIFSIDGLITAEPDPNAVSSQNQITRVPHVDPAVIQQLNNLQDNSVNVKTIFNNARSNPF